MLVAVGIWVLSVVLALPSAVITRVEHFEEEKTNTTVDHNDESQLVIEVCFPFPENFPEWYPPATVLSRALLYYFFPLAVITVFYVLMATHLLSANEVPTSSHHAFDRQLRTRKKVAKIVLCFVVVFAVCFLPTHVFMLWFHLQDESTAQANFNKFWYIVRAMGFCLSFSNSCINPIALYCISGNFRNRYNRYLFCCRRRGTRVNLVQGHLAMSRARSLTGRATDNFTMTTLIHDRPSPAPS